jgi:predicted PurR-regulated permease PerM
MKAAKAAFDVSWNTIAKVLVALALVWVWFQVWHVVLVVIVSIVIAVALHPAVKWLERRGIPAGVGAFGVVLLLAVLCAAMVAISWVTLRNEAQLIVQRLTELSQQLRSSFPLVEQILPGTGAAADGISPYIVGFARSAASAIAMIVVALVLTVYLLIEWKPTVEWLLAFVPERHRPKMRRTLAESRDIVYRYAVGNVLASLITGVVTYFVLVSLSIPAALVLALVSGVFNLVPVIGFIVSAVLAAALAVTVSVNTLALVVAFYVIFNILENYLITPKLFGHELDLSDLAVLIAVIVGSELGGVIGAILALPIAAIYPCVERIWLRERLTGDTVEIHQSLSA